MQRPTILFEDNFSETDVENLKNKAGRLVDLYDEQIRELVHIQNPAVKDQKSLQKIIQEKTLEGTVLLGNWVYFPWSGVLVHTVSEKDYLSLRTNRNKNLISDSEQEKLYGSCIGVIGLSVGAALVLNLVYGGIAKTLKIAELDTLETTNLNRLQSRLEDIGKPKIDILMQRVYEINPYQEFTPFPKGIDKDILKEFISNDPKPTVIFEAIDDFEMKIRLREFAQKERIPVIMFTNLGDNVLIDIERYDLNPDTEFFNGLIGDISERILNNPIGDEDKIKYAIELVGSDHVPTKALESLFEIGETLVGRPQLVSAVSVGGGLGAFLARKIILRQKLNSGRYYVRFETLLGSEEEGSNEHRESLIKKLYEKIGKDD